MSTLSQSTFSFFNSQSNRKEDIAQERFEHFVDNQPLKELSEIAWDSLSS